MPRKTADREIAAQAAPKRRRVAGEEKKAHSWHPFQFYREAEEAHEDPNERKRQQRLARVLANLR